MCGAREAVFECAKPVLSAYCGNIVRIGEAGAGQLAKMVNQIAIAGVVQGLAEAVTFAKAQNLDTDAVLAAISKGAAGSWQMKTVGPPWWKTAMTLALPLIGCARICDRLRGCASQGARSCLDPDGRWILCRNPSRWWWSS